MNSIILILTTILTTSAFAGPANEFPELMTAIQNLSDRVEIKYRTPLLRTQTLSSAGIMVGLGAVAFTGLVRSSRRYFLLSHAVLQISSVTWLASIAAPILRLSILERNGESIRTAEALNTFFALPIARQYRIASRDPDLAKFLIELNHSFEAIAGLTPGATRP